MKELPFSDNLELLINSPSFKKDIEDFRDAVGIPPNGFLSRDQAYSSNYEKPDQFYVLLREIREKYKWPDYLTLNLTDFVLTNSLGVKYDLIHIDAYEGSSRNYVQLLIDVNARIEDVQQIWPEVKKMQMKLNGKPIRKRRKTLKRDIRILELIDERKKHKEIWKILREEYPNDKIGSYPNIAIILGRIRKRLHNIF